MRCTRSYGNAHQLWRMGMVTNDDSEHVWRLTERQARIWRCWHRSAGNFHASRACFSQAVAEEICTAPPSRAKPDSRSQPSLMPTLQPLSRFSAFACWNEARDSKRVGTCFALDAHRHELVMVKSDMKSFLQTPGMSCPRLDDDPLSSLPLTPKIQCADWRLRRE